MTKKPKTDKDPRQIDLEDWLMVDELTTPAPDEIKIALHSLTQKEKTFVELHGKMHEVYLNLHKKLKKENDNDNH